MCHPQPEKKWRKIVQDFLFGVKNESKDIVMIDIEGPSNDVKGITILTITQHVYTMCSLVKRKKRKVSCQYSCLFVNKCKILDKIKINFPKERKECFYVR